MFKYLVLVLLPYLVFAQDLLRVDGQLITSSRRSSDVLIQIYRVKASTDSLLLVFEKEILIKKHKKESNFVTHLPISNRYLWEYTKDNILTYEYLDLSSSSKDRGVHIASKLNSHKACKILKIKIVDDQTDKSLQDAKIKLLYREDKSIVKTFTTDSSGQIQLLVPDNVTVFLVEVKKKDYQFHSDVYSNHKLELMVRLKSAAVNSNFPLDKIFILKGTQFKINEPELLSDNPNLAHLKALIQFLKINANIKVSLTCHTDSRGLDNYNLSLSQQRADHLKNYLESEGIAAKRIKAIGLGETKLQNDCANGVRCSNQKHIANRRVEVKLYR